MTQKAWCKGPARRVTQIMNWGSDDDGDHPVHDADFEKKRNESQALLLEFQRQRAADTVVDKGTKRQQQANIGEVINNLYTMKFFSFHGC